MHRTMVMFTEPQLAWLRAEAERLGISVAELVRRIVDGYRAADEMRALLEERSRRLQEIFDKAGPDFDFSAIDPHRAFDEIKEINDELRRIVDRKRRGER